MFCFVNVGSTPKGVMTMHIGVCLVCEEVKILWLMFIYKFVITCNLVQFTSYVYYIIQLTCNRLFCFNRDSVCYLYLLPVNIRTALFYHLYLFSCFTWCSHNRIQ